MNIKDRKENIKDRKENINYTIKKHPKKDGFYLLNIEDGNDRRNIIFSYTFPIIPPFDSVFIDEYLGEALNCFMGADSPGEGMFYFGKIMGKYIEKNGVYSETAKEILADFVDCFLCV